MRKSRLSGAKRLTAEAASPMESVANLVDVMLVFACGLMMAIVMFWNIDLEKIGDIHQPDGYQNVGLVYKDPETGQVYIVKSGD